MSTSPNVTTPGGFFVGLGGIVSFCIVAIVVYQWVKSPAPSEDLRSQQVALGLRPAPDVKGAEAKKKEAEAAGLIAAAAQRYNGGVNPNLDNLDDLPYLAHLLLVELDLPGFGTNATSALGSAGKYGAGVFRRNTTVSFAGADTPIRPGGSAPVLACLPFSRM